MPIARRLFGALFTGLISAVFAISFAAIIYKGALAPYLDRGIGLILLGAVVLAVAGAFSLSYRGTILAPQDVPAIFLAGAASTLSATSGLSGEALFATVACLVGVASAATGVAGLLVGHLRLAYLARFVPYPVLAGFLAATGLLLLIGGIGVATGDTGADGGWMVYLGPELAFKWVPALVAGAGILLATRLFNHSAALPLALAVTAAAFYLMVWALGLSMQQAYDGGLLMGPFTDGTLWEGIDPKLVMQADWGVIASQTPVIVTIVASCLLGATLNASGLELAFRRDFDISKEVKGAGLSNVLAAFAGGLPGYHIVPETILANRLGLQGSLAGISSGLGCLVILLFGANLLSGLPVGLFAAVLIFLGLDLLYTWTWQERRRLGSLDFAIVLMIPVIALTFGFLTAIAAGLLVACGLFVISYANLNLIRSDTNLGARSSPVERPDTELGILAVEGAAVRVIELAGYLFFGSANTLRNRMQAIIAAQDPRIECLVLDFRHTTGIDVSTLRVLGRLAADCADRDVRLVVSGQSQEVQAEMREALQPHDVAYFDTLNTALEEIEDIVIRHHGADAAGARTEFADIERFLDEIASEDFVERMSLEAGTVLVTADARSDDIYYLYSGQLAVSLATDTGSRIPVATVRPKAIIGEMAYYSGNRRSADIVASKPSVVLRIDMSRIGELEVTNPGLALKFHKAIAGGLARRLQRTTRLLRDLNA